MLVGSVGRPVLEYSLHITTRWNRLYYQGFKFETLWNFADDCSRQDNPSKGVTQLFDD